MKELAAADNAGKRPSMNVPCDGCTACCYHAAVDFDPSEESTEDLQYLETVPIDTNRVRLAKREDGACVHVTEQGCGVYAHRPSPCRHYDCRGMALASMVDTFDRDLHSPVWIFEPRNKKGCFVQEAFRMLDLMHQVMNAKEEKLQRQSTHSAMLLRMLIKR